ncbi:MAG: hypothetical protein AB1938_32360, partial [Myxococcota bacterium]
VGGGGGSGGGGSGGGSGGGGGTSGGEYLRAEVDGTLVDFVNAINIRHNNGQPNSVSVTGASNAQTSMSLSIAPVADGGHRCGSMTFTETGTGGTTLFSTSRLDGGCSAVILSVGLDAGQVLEGTFQGVLGYQSGPSDGGLYRVLTNGVFRSPK